MREKSSIWATLAAAPTNEGGRYRCRLCFFKISQSISSSSNIVSHYRMRHKQIAAEVLSAESITAKNAAMERAMARGRRNQPTLGAFAVQSRALGKSTSPSKALVRRVAGILLVASRQLPLDLLSAPEFEEFVDCCGGTIDKSKTEYIKLLSNVYSIVARFSALETGTVNVGSFTLDGWSANLGAAISGMTFNFVDANWNLRAFPSCFFDT